jgi:zinc protease
MFKGSRNYNKENGRPIWTVLQNVGANVNASTWFDRTNYYAVLPSEFIEEAIAIEADRMRHALLREDDLVAEKTVVRNEYERGENDNFQALDKEIWATAFQAHPYHHPTIGWRDDIENATAASLRRFYETFYYPNNATLSVVGDFPDVPTVLSWIADHFGACAASSHSIAEKQIVPQEGVQRGPRRIVVKRSGRQSILGVAFKSPSGLHEDAPALAVLSVALAGGKTGRLYRRIVDPGHATRVYAWESSLRDPGLFLIYCFLTPQAENQMVETMLWEELEKIKAQGIDPQELERAKSQVSAYLKFSRDGTFGIADGLNESLAMGDWTVFCRNRMEDVQLEDVQRAAQRYFREDTSTTGWFVPIRSDEANEEAAFLGEDQDYTVPTGRIVEDAQTSMDAQRREATRAAPTALPLTGKARASSTAVTKQQGATKGTRGAQIAPRTECVSLFDDGLTQYTLRTAVEDVVTFVGSLAGGTDHGDREPFASLMVAEMMADMFDQGSRQRDKFAISELLEGVGARVSFAVTRNRLRFRARCLRRDLPMVSRLLFEQLTEPRLEAEDFEMAKLRFIGDLEASKESTGRRADELFSAALYPRGHPNFSYPVEELIESLQALRLEDVQRFASLYGLGSDARIVAVGDIDSAELAALVEKALPGGWRSSGFHPRLPMELKALDRMTAANARASAAPPVSSWRVHRMPEKDSVDVQIGQSLGLDANHPDYYAIAMGVFILGGNFSSRLMQVVRDELGLTYGIGAGVEGAELDTDGYWRIAGTFGSENVESGVAATLEQVERWYTHGVQQAELDAKKATVYGSYQVGLATTRGLAGALITTLDEGRPVTWIDDYVDRIGSLTLGQVNAAIRRWVDPDALVVAAAGDINAVDQASPTPP